MGLCPLHEEHKPSFLVDADKHLFYCYGCGRGGDVIRFAELYHGVKFSQALTLLLQWRGAQPLLPETARFYQLQLNRHSEAVEYLHQRGVRSHQLIEHMRIGYAPGGCLRAWLTQLGHGLPVLRQAGLVTGRGYDAYVRRIVFPLEGNLYGRSLSASAPPHRFLPASKGGLYLWAKARTYPDVILVEGLFDYAVLWEAGFRNVTCALGNPSQCTPASPTGRRPPDRLFGLRCRPERQRSTRRAGPAAKPSATRHSRPLDLAPGGHDPNSFFTQGGDARQFQALLEAAQP
jgi:DNA primase